MCEAIQKAKETCPICASKLYNATSKEDGVEIKIKHCKACLWSG